MPDDAKKDDELDKKIEDKKIEEPTSEEDDLDFDDDFDDWDIEEDLEEAEKEEENKPETTPAAAPSSGATKPEKGDKEVKEPSPAKNEPSTAPQAPTPKPVVLEEPIVPVTQVPMALTVELGQIEISLEKLIALEPGNILDLEVHPEEGVQLVVNGKVVGKGEIIQIGESLGVRVLELGHS